MKVYVGTYRRYNSGSLKGAWLDITDYSDKSEFFEACKKLHAGESDPEYMFQDWEDIPDQFISESYVSKYLWEVLDIVPDSEQEAFFSYLDVASYDFNDGVDSVYESFKDAFYGEYKSFDDFLRDWLDNTGFFDGVCETFKHYFDFEAYGQNEMSAFDIYENKFIFCL